ncbi:MAG TPA: DUF5777 family beta-barrel protein [Thermoanaerobaculia bacterium]|nr:DUF5777 family beta-barrel protein [Thermoanaerobaculia bacterium]
MTRRGFRAAAAVAAAVLAAIAGTPAAAQDAPGFPTTVGNRFSQTSTPLVNDKGTFEAVFTHRFNQNVKDAGGDSLFGLDSGASIGIGVEYVPVKNLAVQIYRVNNYADYEFALKATLLRPTVKLPLGVGLRGGLDWRTAPYAPKETSWFGQAIVSYTIADRVTLAAAPSYAQNTQFQQDVWNVPLIAQVKITKTIALIGEYVPKKDYVPDSVGQWSVALEKQVFNHRFALWMGNSQATTVDQYVGGDYNGGVTDRNIRIGFNLSRAWDLFPAAK